MSVLLSSRALQCWGWVGKRMLGDKAVFVSEEKDWLQSAVEAGMDGSPLLL